jgi:protein-tyrosine-phosphatase
MEHSDSLIGALEYMKRIDEIVEHSKGKSIRIRSAGEQNPELDRLEYLAREILKRDELKNMYKKKIDEREEAYKNIVNIYNERIQELDKIRDKIISNAPQ